MNDVSEVRVLRQGFLNTLSSQVKSRKSSQSTHDFVYSTIALPPQQSSSPFVDCFPACEISIKFLEPRAPGLALRSSGVRRRTFRKKFDALTELNQILIPLLQEQEAFDGSEGGVLRLSRRKLLMTLSSCCNATSFPKVDLFNQFNLRRC